jgi:Ca2+-binding EF-hand superfamily protein
MRITPIAAALLALAFASTAVAQQAMPTEEQRMAAFKANDKDGDGKLSKAEYAALVGGMGFGEMADQLFAQRDANKDGFVSAEEYKAPIQQ